LLDDLQYTVTAYLQKEKKSQHITKRHALTDKEEFPLLSLLPLDETAIYIFSCINEMKPLKTNLVVFASETEKKTRITYNRVPL